MAIEIPLKAHVKGFLDYLRLNRNASVHTVRAYQSDLTQLIAFLAADRNQPVGTLSAADLDTALRAATGASFDRLDSDGCMSTNDTVTLLASGASGVTPSLADFAEALTQACTDLTMQLLKDAEGADHENASNAHRRPNSFSATWRRSRFCGVIRVSGSRTSSRIKPRRARAALMGMGLVSQKSRSISGNRRKWVS